MDTSDPSITFDEHGISNHYWDYINYVLPHSFNPDESPFQLEQRLDQIKSLGRSSEYDCLLGLSGGLDSSYMLHKVVTEYGLRPLVFHVDAGWNSDVAVHNIKVLVDSLNLDLFTEVVNWDEICDFQLSLFKAGVPHLDVPQDMAFISILYKYASRHNIKTILNGGNISTECVLMPLQYLYWGSDTYHTRDILKKFSSFKYKTFPFPNIFYHKLYLPYFKGVKVFKPLNYIHYNRNSAIDELVRIYDWKPYPQKHFESRFTRFFEGYWLPSRFGYDMRRNQLSSLILTGQLSRGDALDQLSSPPLAPIEVANEFAYIASKLRISEDELHYYHSIPLRFYWDYRNARKVFDFGERVFRKLSMSRRGGAY